MIARTTALATAMSFADFGSEGGDLLIALTNDDPPIPGEQSDDGLRCVAAIDLLRHLVSTYEEESS